MSVYASIVVEIMVFIILRNPMNKPPLYRTKLRFTRRGVVDQVMDIEVEGILVVAKQIKVLINEISLE